MNKALFLDRDGVINIEKHYLHKVDEFEFLDGILDLCKYFQDQGYYIFVVTNQSGIARGYYTEDDFKILSKWMLDEFSKNCIKIQKVYYFPHHPDISGNCSCRKPNPGMILDTVNEYKIDIEHSIMIGDKERDIEAAINAGINITYLLDENKSVEKSKATKIVSSLKEIIDVNFK